MKNTAVSLYLSTFCLVLLLLCAMSACERPSPCEGFECNYGNCVVATDGTPKCDCYPGYYGENCPYENYDPCQVLECKNGGTCEVDSLNPRQAHCICLPGFGGANCETSNPCYNNNGGCINGTCRDSLGIVVCDCFPGYYGTKCDLINLCYDVACAPNATCNANTGACECVTGYEFAPDCNQAMRQKFLGTYNATDLCAGNTTAYTCEILSGENIQDIIIRNMGDRNNINVKARVLNTTTFVISQTQGFPYTAVPPYDSIYIVAPPLILGTFSTNGTDTSVSFNYKYAFPGQLGVACATNMTK